MKRRNDVRWRYRTILFEFHKDTVFGDKYIDEEDVEKTLNEQGARGWELVNVTLLREGLLAFCKKPEPIAEQKHPARLEVEATAPVMNEEGPRVLKKSEIIAQYSREGEHARRPEPEMKQDVPQQGAEDAVGEIKIR